jgi:uncharacterized protein (DUF488 family)
MDDNNKIFTIGHSTHTFEDFIRMLQLHAVSALVDVRSAPFSRFNPQFNKDVLQRQLGQYSIQYIFLGRELGARSKDPSCYENGKVQFKRLAKTELFQQGVERISRGLCDFRIALMCAEKEPLDCHRTILVADALTRQGMSVSHILTTGALETHEQTMARLIDLVGLHQQDLFRSRSELIEDAMARQEARIAYKVSP